MLHRIENYEDTITFWMLGRLHSGFNNRVSFGDNTVNQMKKNMTDSINVNVIDVFLKNLLIYS